MSRPTSAHQILACTCIRMSCPQQEASPEQQRTALAALAEKHGANVVAEYLDEGISGVATGKRRGFQQMLEDAKAGKFKLILAWDQDRFSRLDSIDSGEIIAPLRRAGVRLVTCAQGEIDWTSFAGRLIFNVQQEGKNQYLIDLSRNTIRGKIAAAKCGKKLSGQNYAYDRLIFDEKGRQMCRVHFRDVFRKPKSWTSKLVPSADIQAVNTVRWMFRAIAYKGYNPQEITDELNRRKVPSARGTHCWRRPVVMRMLRNPVYVGTCVNGTRKTGKFFSMGGPIVVENAHKGLIDRKLFRIVQKVVRPKQCSAAASGYVLKGMLFCGHCGAPMVAHTCTRDGYQDRSYICSRNFTGSTISCCHPSVSAEKLEAFVMQAVIEAIAKESVENIASESASGFDRTQSVKPEIRRLEKEVAKLQIQVQRGLQNLAHARSENVSAISAVSDAKQDELNKQQHDLGVLRGITSDPFVIATSMQQLGLACKNARRDGPDMIKAALSKIIDKIVFIRPKRCHRNSRGTIYFKYGLGLMSTSFSDCDFAPTLYHEAAVVVATLSNGEPITSSQVKDEMGITMCNAYNRLMRAVSAGLLEVAGKGLWKLATAPTGVNGMPAAHDQIKGILARRMHQASSHKKVSDRRSVGSSSACAPIRPIRKTRTNRRRPVKGRSP